MGKMRMLILASLIAPSLACAARAQEAGDPRGGLIFARDTCGVCHAVESGASPSPHRDAPTFTAIAAVPGMTGAALLSSLNTSHRMMPNLILPPDDVRNVVAYILSLK